jgi:hypothetical protein
MEEEEERSGKISRVIQSASSETSGVMTCVIVSEFRYSVWWGRTADENDRERESERENGKRRK